MFIVTTLYVYTTLLFFNLTHHYNSSAQDIAAAAKECLMCVGLDFFFAIFTAQHISCSKWWTAVRASHVLSATANSSLKLHPNPY